VFRNCFRAAKGVLIRAAASTQTFGGSVALTTRMGPLFYSKEEMVWQ
jgi:hypothetical protein